MSAWSDMVRHGPKFRLKPLSHDAHNDMQQSDTMVRLNDPMIGRDTIHHIVLKDSSTMLKYSAPIMPVVRSLRLEQKRDRS